MMLEEGICQYLLGVEAISALVGIRVYGLSRPQGKRPLPELLISRTQTSPQQLFCGQDGLLSAQVQLDCFAMNVSQSGQLARAARQSLRNFSGNMSGVSVDEVFLANEFQLDDPEPGTVRMVQTYTFWYQED